MTKLDELLDTQARNQRFRHYDVAVVLVPFGHLRMLSDGHHKRRAEVANDKHLTTEGKVAALAKAQAATRAAIDEWHQSRLKNIDADLLEQKAALRGNVAAPDQKRVDLMASHLLKHTPDDIAGFFDKATEAERIEMEAASASVGRVPMKGPNGREWKPLLDVKMVEASILERAEVTNPTAAQRVRELSEIRAMQVTITGVALSEI
jgi:hypothetical protein